MQSVPGQAVHARDEHCRKRPARSHAITEKSPYVNAIDAAASGTTDGLRLALNVAAMLIVFIAFVAMFDALLAEIKPLLVWLGCSANWTAWPDDLSLKDVFGWLFSPAAFLMGVDLDDVHKVGSLLGTKLALERTCRLSGFEGVSGRWTRVHLTRAFAAS